MKKVKIVKPKYPHFSEDLLRESYRLWTQSYLENLRRDAGHSLSINYANGSVENFIKKFTE
jgi:hypothetical protein